MCGGGAFLLGIVGGSFVGVVVTRREKKEGWIGGKSRCDYCKRELEWWENIPLFSFLFLKGKCRSCHSPIPFWYFLLEGGTGIIFLLTFLFWKRMFSFSLSSFFILLLWWLISGLLIFLFVFDLRNQLIPDEAVIGLLFLGLIDFFLSPFSLSLKEKFLGMVVASGFLFLLYLFTKGKGMGLGDVKFSLFLGFFLGLKKTILLLYLAFLTGGILSVIMILLKKKSWKEKIAFGPFLITAFFVSWWWGERFVKTISLWLSF